MPKNRSADPRDPDLSSLEQEPDAPKDVPLYGNMLEDIVPPEHFLWQIQGAHPGFDDLIRLLYLRREDFYPVRPELWPEHILIPGDFYVQSAVIPQLTGSFPEGDTPVPGETEAAAPEEESPVEPLSHSVSPQAEAYGAESVRGYDGYEDYSGYSDRPEDYENAPEPDDEELEWKPLTPEMMQEIITDIQSRLAAANWEVFKDIVSYSAEDFARFRAQAKDCSGFLPEALFRPFRTFCFWVSLAKIRFELYGERCLGCFVYRSMNVTSGTPAPTFTLGFLTHGSFFDYSIPLTPHATLDYILESSADFLGGAGNGALVYTEEEKRATVDDMKRIWRFMLPVIAHVCEELPKHPRFRARKSLRAAVLRRRGMNSATVRHWRWDEEKGKFVLSCPPALLQGPLAETFLREFVKIEAEAPFEAAGEPGECPILN